MGVDGWGRWLTRECPPDVELWVVTNCFLTIDLDPDQLSGAIKRQAQGNHPRLTTTSDILERHEARPGAADCRALGLADS